MGIQDDDIASVRAATDIVAVVSEHVAAQAGGASLGRACARSTTRRRARSRSTPRRSCTTASAAGPRATSSPSCGRSSTSTSSAPWSSWPAKAGIALRYTDEHQSEGRKRRAKLLDGGGPGRRVVPPAPAVGARRRRGPGLPPLPGPHRRRGAGLPGRLGARRAGTSWPGPCGCPTDVFVEAGLGLRQQPRPADRRLPGPGAVPDLRRAAATRSASAAGSCPATRAPSTRTPVDSPSTTSPGCSTGSTGPRPTSSGPTRRSCARATPT